tara:strand:- start:63387 stop:63533 length:147 start_codon:yes stop_codon:yes gene_type:complete
MIFGLNLILTHAVLPDYSTKETFDKTTSSSRITDAFEKIQTTALGTIP